MGQVTGAIGGLLGGTPNGQNFQAEQAHIEDPLMSGQANDAYQRLNSSLDMQKNLAQQLSQQNGLQNQQNVFQQQQSLANALQLQANGQGPNPAQAQLAQATGANTANQAALMASQRGSGANAGLMARQAAQQGAANQQQAVGQAATMQAQQQISAQQQLAAQQAQMQGVASNQVGNQLAGVGNLTNATLGNEGQVLNAANAFNSAKVGNMSQANSANQAMAGINANNTAKAIGSLTNAAGGAAGIPGMGKAQGGVIEDPHLAEMHKLYHGGFADGGEVPIMVSPGEKYIPPGEVKAVAQGVKSLAHAGKMISGKAPVKGDSAKNDTVPLNAEEGAVVIPRTVMMSDDPLKEGTKFLVEALKKHAGKKEHSDFHDALKKAISARGK